MSTIEERFLEFHQNNEHVYREIVRLARVAKARGHRRYGIDLLLAVLRFRHDMQTARDSSGFKLNNTFRSRYARLVDAQERCSEACDGCADPTCLAGFFELRVLRSA